MTLRLLFLGEGASDSGIAYHVERIATDAGFDVMLSDPDLSRLPKAPADQWRTSLARCRGLAAYLTSLSFIATGTPWVECRAWPRFGRLSRP